MAAPLLIYGHDALLVKTRSWVLEKSGCDVLTTTDDAAVRKLITEVDVELLILCHTLTRAAREAALSEARRLRPAMRKLILTPSPADFSPRQDEMALSAFADPRTLIAAVEQMTSQPDPVAR